MIAVWKIVAFVIASGVLIYFSRKSFRIRHSHGFYRFFAFEYILALFLLNVDSWLHEPFSWHQMISWILLCISLLPLILGIYALRKHGKPGARQEDETHLIAFEKTTSLVTIGIFHYIRHPMYSSLLLLAWGIFFKNVSWAGAIIAFLATASIVMTARADEAECIHFFGQEYQHYMQHTRRFIPWIY